MLKELNVIFYNVNLELVSVNNAETFTNPNPRTTFNIRKKGDFQGLNHNHRSIRRRARTFRCKMYFISS